VTPWPLEGYTASRVGLDDKGGMAHHPPSLSVALALTLPRSHALSLSLSRVGLDDKGGMALALRLLGRC